MKTGRTKPNESSCYIPSPLRQNKSTGEQANPRNAEASCLARSARKGEIANEAQIKRFKRVSFVGLCNSRPNRKTLSESPKIGKNGILYCRIAFGTSCFLKTNLTFPPSSPTQTGTRTALRQAQSLELLLLRECNAEK